MTMLACKFRLYPSRAVEDKLESALNGCRVIYNEILGQMNEAREHGTRPDIRGGTTATRQHGASCRRHRASRSRETGSPVVHGGVVHSMDGTFHL
jgi:hypothetical protein